MIAFIGMVALVIWLYTVKFKDVRAKFRAWKKSHRDAIDTVVDGVKVVFCTLQTLCLVTDNHLEAGGEEPPWIYAKFLESISWVTMDLMAAVPGMRGDWGYGVSCGLDWGCEVSGRS